MVSLIHVLRSRNICKVEKPKGFMVLWMFPEIVDAKIIVFSCAEHDLYCRKTYANENAKVQKFFFKHIAFKEQPKISSYRRCREKKKNV